MKRPDFDVPDDLIQDFTARAAVLSDMFRNLSDPKTAATVIGGLVAKDREIHAGFLDRLDPDRWPLGRLDLCLRIPDYIAREFSGPWKDSEVWIIRANLTVEEQWQFFLIQWRMMRKGEDTTTRIGRVFGAKNGLFPLGDRAIVPDGAFQDALKAAGLLEPAFERVRDTFEIMWPTGGYIDLCLPR